MEKKEEAVVIQQTASQYCWDVIGWLLIAFLVLLIANSLMFVVTEITSITSSTPIIVAKVAKTTSKPTKIPPWAWATSKPTPKPVTKAAPLIAKTDLLWLHVTVVSFFVVSIWLIIKVGSFVCSQEERETKNNLQTNDTWTTFKKVLNEQNRKIEDLVKTVEAIEQYLTAPKTPPAPPAEVDEVAPTPPINPISLY